jgi:SAM-dependent methyltransferase
LKDKTKTLTNYDHIASHYDRFRRPSPVILDLLKRNFSNLKGPVLSLGCGTGRMESALSEYIQVFGLDLSRGMLAQAAGRGIDLVLGNMTQIPFRSGIFSGIYCMQSLHHVGANLDISPDDRVKARYEVLKEARRVIKTGPLIIIQRDPTQNQAVWFWKYFPAALQTKLKIQPRVKEITNMLENLGFEKIVATPVDDPMAKRFYDPKAPLDPQFRNSFSDFSYLTPEEVDKGKMEIMAAIKEGTVEKEIDKCKNRFEVLGGTVYLIRGLKT